MNKILRILSATTIGTLISAHSLGSEHSMEPSFGYATLADADYGTSGTAMLSYVYSHKGFTASLGGFSIPDLEPKTNGTSVDARSKGYHLMFGKDFKSSALDLNLRAGLAQTETDIWLGNRQIGENESIGAALSIELLKPLSKVVALRGGILYLDDVASDSLYIYSVGVRITFN